MTAPSQFIRFLTGWRTSLQKLVPNWQTQRPNAVVGWRWLWSMILPIDITVENTLQGVNDWGPGSPDASTTALPLIAQSRGLIQGEAETDAHFALRLLNWRTNGLATAPPATPQVWSQRGKNELLAQQIQQYLGNNPLVRVIQRIYSTSGTPQAVYTTANTDGTTSVATAAWDWDSVSGWTDGASTYPGSVTRTWWSDMWIVVYPCEWAVTGTTLANLVPIWGTANLGLGHAVGRTARDAILSLVAQWKGIYTYVRAIIYSYDSTLFDPANPGASGNPDGTWGYSFKMVPTIGGNTMTKTRTGSTDGRVRYWFPQKG